MRLQMRNVAAVQEERFQEKHDVPSIILFESQNRSSKDLKVATFERL